MDISVLLLSRYERKGPSSRLRHYNYLPALERAGFRVTSAPFLNDKYLEQLYRGERPSSRLLVSAYWRRLRQILTARRYDLIWIEKEALPWLPAMLERPFFGGRPVVIDFDDPWHLRYATHGNAMVRAFLGNKLESVAAKATAVTAGSPELTEWARLARASCVIDLPPAVDLERYPVLPLPDGPFTIGWIGTPRNEPYLQVIAEPLRRLHEACGARLRVIGGGHLSIPGVPIDQIPWREDTEAKELAACHVGVMPLLEGAWERGKCGYKVIQYMAAGRAAVASDVGASKSIIVPGETGFLAANAQEWFTALEGLAANRKRAHAVGLAARQRAQAMYSLPVSAAKLVETLRAAIAGRVPVSQ